jgi:hypothetical protein
MANPAEGYENYMVPTLFCSLRQNSYSGGAAEIR